MLTASVPTLLNSDWHETAIANKLKKGHGSIPIKLQLAKTEICLDLALRL